MHIVSYILYFAHLAEFVLAFSDNFFMPVVLYSIFFRATPVPILYALALLVDISIVEENYFVFPPRVPQVEVPLLGRNLGFTQRYFFILNPQLNACLTGIEPGSL